ncbi:Lrp/AsnC family transcriptional regulator [Motiliproteus sp. MSK22-1]|uniref:siroheme decarboxylase subunit beta n=1 Tax=Motiliproteus sp. MSK22-1 TaxID=1897630 RepID=UPI0009763CE3|nr:Lrp/AsnC family transcriptional regulator [Motiliproteus sp. MSK22-1]OMH36249.1 hypothetical protein BGP75_09870 [Motiliproteus sp. MSK22-1]
MNYKSVHSAEVNATTLMANSTNADLLNINNIGTNSRGFRRMSFNGGSIHTAKVDIDPTDASGILLQALQEGLPIVERPYAKIADQLGWTEQRVIDELESLSKSDRVRRMGIIVKHRALGFTANAMVVWDIPDDEVDAVAERMAEDNCVTLCYQRPRRLPQWPYNLFCMIHGQERDQVLGRLDQLVENLSLQQYAHQPLFSTRCFKQCGGRYFRTPKNGTADIGVIKSEASKVEVSSMDIADINSKSVAMGGAHV